MTVFVSRKALLLLYLNILFVVVIFFTRQAAAQKPHMEILSNMDTVERPLLRFILAAK